MAPEVPKKLRRQRSKTHSAASLPRESAINKPLRSDPYELTAKLPEPSACPDCHAIYRKGRWAWGAVPANARAIRCPACHRIADGYPAGLVRLRGEYLAAHRNELEQIAHNLAERERTQHPLKRIIAVRTDGAELEITTTDAKLARAIGKALHAAHKGRFTIDGIEREGLLRVAWER